MGEVLQVKISYFHFNHWILGKKKTIKGAKETKAHSETENNKHKQQKTERAAYKKSQLGNIRDMENCSADEMDDVLQSQSLDNRK